MKDKNTIKAKVVAISEGQRYEHTITFMLIPPEDGAKFYGTGYHMAVAFSSNKFLVDVRYEQLKDIKLYALDWIICFFGINIHEIVFE